MRSKTKEKNIEDFLKAEKPMLKFDCKNLGTNCSYIAAGITVEDVK
jgi:hypothetical protein